MALPDTLFVRKDKWGRGEGPGLSRLSLLGKLLDGGTTWEGSSGPQAPSWPTWVSYPTHLITLLPASVI